MNIEFERAEVQQLVNILANCKGFSWSEVNPLLLKLAQAQGQPPDVPALRPASDKQRAAGADRAA